MSYEPRGKIAALLAAMRADDRVWTGEEVRAALEVQSKAVTGFTDTAVRNGALHRRVENGRLQFSLHPFPTPIAERRGAVTTANGWAPPKMVAPRGTPAPAEASAPVPTAAPEPARALADASTHAGEQDEPTEAVTWNVWEDGDLDLHGLVELENGGYRMPAEAVRRLRKFIAWMPA